MPLNSSGPISIGGTTVGQSINLELGRTATASSNLNESALRNLAVKPSGAISMNDFRGKFAVNVGDVTVTNEPVRGVAYTGRYQLNSDGNIYITDSFGTLYNYTPWLTSGTGSASSYEVRVGTLDNAGGTPGGTFNTWLGLGTTREWTLAVGSAEVALRTGVVEIRNAATGQVLDTGSVYFNLDTS